jgi:rhodanese-related sulfurtransferase
MKTAMQESRRIASAGLGFLAVVWLQPALVQEPEGEFVDGEFVEGYTYVPDFMSPDELKAAIEARRDDIVIVDTAAPLIWEDEHIPGAVNLPWVHELALPVTLPREKTIVLYCACQDHEDSADMAKKLSLAGYLKVKVLEGGWFEWTDLGYPTVSKAEEDANEQG